MTNKCKSRINLFFWYFFSLNKVPTAENSDILSILCVSAPQLGCVTQVTFHFHKSSHVKYTADASIIHLPTTPHLSNSASRISVCRVEGFPSPILKMFSMMETSVAVVSWPQKAIQSLTTKPAAITSLPLFTVPAWKHNIPCPFTLQQVY